VRARACVCVCVCVSDTHVYEVEALTPVHHRHAVGSARCVHTRPESVGLQERCARGTEVVVRSSPARAVTYGSCSLYAVGMLCVGCRGEGNYKEKK
jgi:hypothetical protein